MSGTSRKLAEGRLLSLRELEAFLIQTIREGKAASSDHEKWQALELGARATLMVCNILIVGLEAATGPAGAAVSKMYDGAKFVTDAALTGKIDPNTGWVLLAKNKVKIAELSAKGLGKSRFSRFLVLTQELVGYGEAMWGLFSGASSMQRGGNSGINASIRTATAQLERIRRKIREISAELKACEAGDSVSELLLS